MSELSLAAFIGAVFLLAGGIKGVLGLGLPTVGMGLLSIVMTPAPGSPRCRRRRTFFTGLLALGAYMCVRGWA